MCQTKSLNQTTWKSHDVHLSLSHALLGWSNITTTNSWSSGIHTEVAEPLKFRSHSASSLTNSRTESLDSRLKIACYNQTLVHIFLPPHTNVWKWMKFFVLTAMSRCSSAMLIYLCIVPSEWPREMVAPPRNTEWQLWKRRECWPVTTEEAIILQSRWADTYRFCLPWSLWWDGSLEWLALGCKSS